MVDGVAGALGKRISRGSARSKRRKKQQAGRNEPRTRRSSPSARVQQFSLASNRIFRERNVERGHGRFERGAAGGGGGELGYRTRVSSLARRQQSDFGRRLEYASAGAGLAQSAGRHVAHASGAPRVVRHHDCYLHRFRVDVALRRQSGAAVVDEGANLGSRGDANSDYSGYLRGLVFDRAGQLDFATQRCFAMGMEYGHLARPAGVFLQSASLRRLYSLGWCRARRVCASSADNAFL